MENGVKTQETPRVWEDNVQETGTLCLVTMQMDKRKGRRQRVGNSDSVSYYDKPESRVLPLLLQNHQTPELWADAHSEIYARFAVLKKVWRIQTC